MERVVAFKSSAMTMMVGAVGGFVASVMHWPLPWMVGSMCAVILVNCCKKVLSEVPSGRKVGQWLIASVIGLHFTASVMDQVSTNFVLMIGAALITLSISLLGVMLLARREGCLPTCFFSLMPANSAEMMVLGLKHRADAALVAAAHSLRLVMIVLIIPAAMAWGLGGHGHVSSAQVDWRWISLLLPTGFTVAWVWSHVGLPNPWAFGPMLVCAVFTLVFDLHLSLPTWLTILGQLLLGCSLGVHFDRGFFRRAPLFLSKIFLINCLTMAVGFLVAVVISDEVGISKMTLMLGMVPGSSTEMSLTAEALGLGVALVTAMQIIRMVVVMALAEPVYRAWAAGRATKPI